MIETIAALVTTSKGCNTLAGVLQAEITLGKESWDNLRGWLAALPAGQGFLPPKARRLVALLAQTPYEDLARLVFLLEEKAAALGAGAERAAV